MSALTILATGRATETARQPLDHGVLNVPLIKRGDIDAAIDRYKAEQRAAERQRAAAHRVARADAKKAVAAIPAARIAEIAASTGSTPKKVSTWLNSMAHWQPEKAMRVAAKEMK